MLGTLVQKAHPSHLGLSCANVQVGHLHPEPCSGPLVSCFRICAAGCVRIFVGLLLVLGLCAGQEHEGLDWLIESVPGVPGEDYPIYAEVPDTGFSCDGQVEGGEVV